MLKTATPMEILERAKKIKGRFSYYVVDNPYNRAHNKEIIGLFFEVAPSYTAVIYSESYPDYYDIEHYRKRHPNCEVE